MYMADLTLEQCLARLLRIVPKISLDNRAIHLIADGSLNQVIAEFNGTWTPEEEVITKIEDIKEEDSDTGFPPVKEEEEKPKKKTPKKKGKSFKFSI